MNYVGDDTGYFGDDADDDDYLGGESDELALILGADASRKPRMMANNARARAAMAAARAGLVASRMPQTFGPTALPIPTTAFSGSQTLSITVQPQRTFRLERPYFPSSQAVDFLINDILINQNSVFPAPGGVSAELFTEVAVGAALFGQTVRQGAIISMNITNINAAARTLRGAALKGSALY